MKKTETSARTAGAKPELYRRLKIRTQEGKLSTVSIDPGFYRMVEHKVGADRAITVARNAALRYDSVRTNAKRSAYVVQQLRSTFGIGRPDQPAALGRKNKYSYVTIRVRDAQGNITSASLPPRLLSRIRRKLNDEQIRTIANDAAAAHDPTSIFTRSEHIKRTLLTHIGQKVPSELQLFRRKFHLTTVQLASMLHVAPSDIKRWEERNEIESGPARMIINMLWREQLSLSTLLKTKRPD
jgi:DNA-binding transcriptional regulator YiaG